MLNKNALIVLLMILLPGIAVSADDVSLVNKNNDAVLCRLPETIHVANYDIQEEGGTAETLQLLRTNEQVMHIRSQAGSAELWELNSRGEIHFTRYYDQAQRAVEFYQQAPMDRSTTLEWAHVWQLVPATMLAGEPVAVADISGCAHREIYEYLAEGAHYRIEWLPAYQLPSAMTIRRHGQQLHWHLQAASGTLETLTSELAQRAGYKLIDYADLGDQESDAFFRSLRDQEHHH
ncbi:MAG: hypothetical protein ACK5ME_01655 [Parahaliea sp.]